MFPEIKSIFWIQEGVKKFVISKGTEFSNTSTCTLVLVKKLAHPFYLSYPTFHLEQWRRWRPPPLSSINYFLSSPQRPPLLSGNILLILSQELHHRHYLCLS